MKKQQKTVTFVILKGNKDVEGVMIKRNAVNVLLRFFQRVYKTDFRSGSFTYVMAGVPTDILGNPQWMNENVFRKADIYGTTNDSEADARAERLYQAYLDLDKGGDNLGLAVIKYMLDKMYIQYDVLEG